MSTRQRKKSNKVKKSSLSGDISQPINPEVRHEKTSEIESESVKIPVSETKSRKTPEPASGADKTDIALLKPQIDQPISEPQNMEVHHHPQLEHKPKPWKEYLLEGFMIFIAVMMGFIAENIREYITDNEHTRQLTLQLVHDLKADTAQLNYIYLKESQIVTYNDTLFNLLQQPLKSIDNRKIQKLAASSHSMWPFHPSAGAIYAIKNELHLKQFSNSKIISYFSGYERDIELLHTAQDVNLQYQRIYLDPFITRHFTPANMVVAFNHLSLPSAQMRNLTQADIDQLAADMVLIKIVSQEMVRDNRGLEKDAVEMLRYVKSYYHLEDDLQ